MGFDTKVKPDGVVDAAISTVMDQVRKLDSMASQYRGELTQA